MDSIITVNNISFFYKNLQALKDISFLVNPGDFIALMGVNGAEKSVCLHRIQCAASCCGLVFDCLGQCIYGVHIGWHLTQGSQNND